MIYVGFDNPFRLDNFLEHCFLKLGIFSSGDKNLMAQGFRELGVRKLWLGGIDIIEVPIRGKLARSIYV